MKTKNINHFISNVFMIAGCAMGAGCLAIPMVASGANFMFSALFLIIAAIFSYYLAATSLEIFILYKNNVNISTIVKDNFGNYGVMFSALINGALMYTILSVYMNGGADLLNQTIMPLFDLHISSKLSLTIFLLIFLPVFFKGAKLVIRLNKLIFWLKLISFVIVILFGIKYLNHNLNVINNDEIRYIPHAFPIFLTGLWFHFIIPIVAKLNNYNRNQCKKIFAYGITIPAILYILWVGVCLSLIPRNSDTIANNFFNLLHNKQSVGTMINYALYNNPSISIYMRGFLNLFANIAILTSFLTVGIATYDYVRDSFSIKQNTIGVIINLTITMLPPIIFSILFPNGFIFILQQAAILLLITNIIIIACIIKKYSSLEQTIPKPLLFLILCILFGLIILQILDNFNYLPSYGLS